MLGILGGTFDPDPPRPPAHRAGRRRGGGARRGTPHPPAPRRAPRPARDAGRAAPGDGAGGDRRRGRASSPTTARSVATAPSYTLHTLESLRAECGRRRADLRCSSAATPSPSSSAGTGRTRASASPTLIVMRRPGAERSRTPRCARFVERHRAARGGELRARPAAGVLFQPVTQLDISATDIRARWAQGRSARYLVPDAVLELIRRRRALRAAGTGDRG